MDLLIPSPGLLLWQLVVFLGLFFILRKYAWGPITEALSERENEIDSALRMAEETRAEMAKLKSDNERLVAEARAERDAILKEAREAAANVVAKSKDDASAEANRILTDARESIQQEKAAMLSQVRKDVASLSLEIAEKVLRKELSDKSAQEALVSNLLTDAKLN